MAPAISCTRSRYRYGSHHQRGRERVAEDSVLTVVTIVIISTRVSRGLRRSYSSEVRPAAFETENRYEPAHWLARPSNWPRLLVQFQLRFLEPRRQASRTA